MDHSQEPRQQASPSDGEYRLAGARRPNGAHVSSRGEAGERYPEQELTRAIIGCAVQVHKALGPGFLESIYENALAHELSKQGLRFTRQAIVKVHYDGIEVGEHRLDLFVESRVVVELKSVDAMVPKHTAQLISTLKAVGARVGLLINFDEIKLVDGLQRVVL